MTHAVAFGENKTTCLPCCGDNGDQHGLRADENPLSYLTMTDKYATMQDDKMKTAYSPRRKSKVAYGNVEPIPRVRDNGMKLYVLDLDDLEEVKGNGRWAIVGVDDNTRMATLDDAGYPSRAEAVRAIRVSEVVAKAKKEGTAAI